MKNVLITMLLAAGLLFAGNQQASAQQDISFGVKGGISFYNINTSVSAGGFSIDETSDSRLGFAVGAYAIVPVHELFDFRPELLFVQKGGKDAGGDDDFFDDGDTELILNYIDIPLLVQFNIPVETDLNPYLIAGPTVGVLVSATEKFDDVSQDAEDVKSLNFGFNIGAGVNFGQLNVDLRYEFGLSNIFEDEDFEDDFFDLDFSVKTSGLMLTVGYQF